MVQKIPGLIFSWKIEESVSSNSAQNEIVQIVEDEQCPAQNPRNTHPHSRGGKARHHSRTRRCQSTDRKCNVGLVMNQKRNIVKLFQIVMKTAQRKNPFIRRSESVDRTDQDSPDSVQRNEIHQVQCIDKIDRKMQRSLKLPQVRYINKIIQKVQLITEVSQQQCMNVDVPAEIQCQKTATHQNTVKDAPMQRQVQMIQKMPSGLTADIQNLLMPRSSEAKDEFVQPPSPALQISSRRQTSLR